jgi:hypothetical protein
VKRQKGCVRLAFERECQLADESESVVGVQLDVGSAGGQLDTAANFEGAGRAGGRVAQKILQQ